MNSKKFVLYDQEIDNKVSEIKRLIFLSMNGVVSESIEQKGVFYKKNFGVSLYRLKQIAKKFEKNSILASQLWNLQYRETMILAIFLQPIDEFSFLKATEWSNEIQTLELAEIASKNLFSELDFSEQLADKCTGENKSLQTAISFFIFAEIVEKLAEEKLLLLVLNAFKQAIEGAETCRAVIVFLQKVTSINETLKQRILIEIERMKSSDLYAERLIYEELMTHILYS